MEFRSGAGSFYKWENVNALFASLNEAGCNYAILRNYENMHEAAFFVGGHEDIDVICDDVKKFVDVTHAVCKIWPEDDVHYVTFIGDEIVPIDIRHVGDCYYDNKWEKEMLDRSKLASNGNWKVLDENDYYYTLIYHAIVQKREVAKEYIKKLDDMARDLEVEAQGVESHLDMLYKYMESHQYVFCKPKDLSVQYQIKYVKSNTQACKEKVSVRCLIQNACKCVKDKLYRCRFIRNAYFGYRNGLLKKEIAQYNKLTGEFDDIRRISNKLAVEHGEDVYDQLAQRRVYRYIDIYKNEIEEEYTHVKSKMLLKINKNVAQNTVWTMWWQGLDSAPAVVKSCIDSFNRLNRPVVVLTEKNISEFIDLPKYILEKYTRGDIGHAHFSDIVRVYLVTMYGGTWIDSTVYIADDVPDYMLDSFFVFKQSPQLRECRKYGNWWIASKPENTFLMKVLATLYVYWKNENVAYHYYFFHVIWRYTVDKNEKYAKLLDSIFSRYTDTTHLLLRAYNKKYNAKEWEQMKRISPVFKCSYKAKGFSASDTYYCKLCQNKLP